MLPRNLLLLFLSVQFCIGYSQVGHKVVGEKNEHYRDSLENAERLYIFPLFGSKVQEKGYDLPLPAGLMLGFYTAEQNILLDDLSVGFDPDNLANISDIVAFEYITTNTTAFTFRPDLWIFPFMNIYAIANKIYSKTDVKLSQPFELVIPQVTSDGEGLGLGTSLAYGFGPVWASGNFNWSWTWMPTLVDPMRSFSTSIRIGTLVQTKNRKHKFSIWGGANYLNYKGNSGGSYDMTQLLPDGSDNLNNLLEKVDEMLDGLNDKYEDFCSTPGNGPTCAVVDPILEELKGRIEDKIAGIEKPDEVRINYTFDSSPEKNWNMIVGTQYHFNKRWEARAEFGFIGRTSFLFNVNYRFGILKRKS